PGGLMAALVSSEDRPPRNRRPRTDRWLSEVKAILALAVAGFGLIALATFDPSRPPAVQQSPVGPVGVWLGWAAFQSFGYAGFLFPLLLGAWGASAFVRPPVTRGVLPFTGLTVLLVSAAGLLAQASTAPSRGAAERHATTPRGLVGWAVRTALRTGGAELFQLPPVGLLQAPPATELRRTREELRDNAETLRRKLQDFEVEGRIVQVSPGPIITSYEFEPAPGIKVSQVVNLADDLA